MLHIVLKKCKKKKLICITDMFHICTMDSYITVTAILPYKATAININLIHKRH